MTAPDVLLAGVIAALETMTQIPAHKARVPSDLPADACGRVYPYTVVWPGAGAPPTVGEQDVAATSTGLAWRCQVTVASGDVDWTLQATSEVRARLHHATIATGVLLAQETLADLRILPDESTRPTRWYTPMPFYALAP